MNSILIVNWLYHVLCTVHMFLQKSFLLPSLSFVPALLFMHLEQTGSLMQTLLHNDWLPLWCTDCARELRMGRLDMSLPMFGGGVGKSKEAEQCSHSLNSCGASLLSLFGCPKWYRNSPRFPLGKWSKWRFKHFSLISLGDLFVLWWGGRWFPTGALIDPALITGASLPPTFPHRGSGLR